MQEALDERRAPDGAAALTDAARHGFGAAARSRSRDGRDSRSRPRAGRGRGGRAGHGIVGMRERAALLGGTLEAGATDGDFRVRAPPPLRAGGAAVTRRA